VETLNSKSEPCDLESVCTREEDVEAEAHNLSSVGRWRGAWGGGCLVRGAGCGGWGLKSRVHGTGIHMLKQTVLTREQHVGIEPHQLLSIHGFEAGRC